jgi:hypothetical protein
VVIIPHSDHIMSIIVFITRNVNEEDEEEEKEIKIALHDGFSIHSFKETLLCITNDITITLNGL